MSAHAAALSSMATHSPTDTSAGHAVPAANASNAVACALLSAKPARSHLMGAKISLNCRIVLISLPNQVRGLL